MFLIFKNLENKNVSKKGRIFGVTENFYQNLVIFSVFLTATWETEEELGGKLAHFPRY